MKRKEIKAMGKNCSKPENRTNERKSQFIQGMSATKIKQPDNHIPNQKKTKKVVI